MRTRVNEQMSTVFRLTAWVSGSRRRPIHVPRNVAIARASMSGRAIPTTNLSRASVRSARASSILVQSILLAGLLFAGCTKTDTGQQQMQSETQVSPQETPKTEEYYTCPMHPSVRSDRPGACPVCGMALVKKSAQAAMDAAEVSSLEAVSLSPTQRVMANVSVVPAKRQEFKRDITAVGIISYAEPNYQHISSRFPGRVEKLYVSYTGQEVREGDRVAEVYSPEAITAQQEYLLALDSYEQAQHSNQSFVSSAEQLLEQSRQKLLHWGFTERQIARLRESRKVEYTVTIYSPVRGTVVKKSVDPQRYVGVGEDMFDVADLSTVWGYLDVYEKEIRFVERGQRVQIKTEAYPFETFEGTVVFIDPVVHPDTRTIRVRTEFKNPTFKLKPNMFVTGTIVVPKMRALVVPSSAIISTGKRTVVWVEVKENTFEPRDVIVGATADGWTTILNGLDEGEHVVETGGFLLDSESALQKPATPSPHEGHAVSTGKRERTNAEVHSTASVKVQEVRITVKDGYSPDVVRVKQGIPVKLVFQRDERSRCSEELVIKNLGLRKTLAPFAATPIEFTPTGVGEFPFACGMDMLHGKIVVESR